MRLFWLACLALAFACHDDWNGKRGWTNCKDAVGGATPWPRPPCPAMEMCANEASFTAAEDATLRAQMRHAGCAPP